MMSAYLPPSIFEATVNASCQGPLFRSSCSFVGGGFGFAVFSNFFLPPFTTVVRFFDGVVLSVPILYSSALLGLAAESNCCVSCAYHLAVCYRSVLPSGGNERTQRNQAGKIVRNCLRNFEVIRVEESLSKLLRKFKYYFKIFENCFFWEGKGGEKLGNNNY